MSQYEKLHQLKVVQTEFIDQDIPPGILYVSKRFNLAIHLCACGCGCKTVMPIDPEDGWVMSGTDEIITFRPSILNPVPFCPNGAHYYITENRIDWL